ncbi:MAG: DNA topoisomerase I, partial [Gammaproteobacteria bacterium]|nr:DNA topoisomerase I [Gammaproteobacteria bacterium]
ALDEIRAFIDERFGGDKLPPRPKLYRTKAKNAQEAHEAIRPTSVFREPDKLEKHLTRDQLRLYELIWKRTIACQMAHAVIATVGVDLGCGKDHTFRATGSTVVSSGYMSIYQEGKDDKKGEGDERMLPPLEMGQDVLLNAIRPEQHFTEPPPRYNEATLVKTLEEHGIGRPSTYASIISTLLHREYVVQEKRRFRPTDVGRIVNRFLTQHFTKYVDYDFTAGLEDDLDAISRGEKQWVPVMGDFWTEFKQLVVLKEKSVSRKDVTQEIIDESCPQCGTPLAIRLGRRGRFIGCTDYPTCDYTRNMDNGDKEAEKPEVVAGRSCPKCSSDLLIRNGRYGKFIGCSSYPKCDFMEPIEKPTDTGVTCPQCGDGALLKRKSRRGKVFYSCATYPRCSYAIWNEPVKEGCPDCGWPILTLKTTKRHGTQKVCPQQECRFSISVEDIEKEAVAN